MKCTTTPPVPSVDGSEAAELVAGAIDLLREPLGRFVRRKLERQFGGVWRERALGALQGSGFTRARPEDLERDVSAILNVISKFWHVAFSHGSPRFSRQYLEEAREFRNGLAHGERFDISDAFRALDTVDRLLRAIEAPEQEQSARIRRDALRLWSVAVDVA